MAGATMSDEIQIIKEWFQDSGGGGLILPNGWVGRPHDNIHLISNIQSRPSWIYLELDDRILLVLTKPITVRKQGNDALEIEFTACGFNWRDFGSTVDHWTNYKSGMLRFVSPPGR